MADNRAGRKNLQNQNFSGQDLRGKDFFSGADLQGSNFSGAKLQGVDFSSAEIQGANFHKADLRGAKFISASGESVNFSNAEIQGADFSGAELSNANFTEANVGLSESGKLSIILFSVILSTFAAFLISIVSIFSIRFFRGSRQKLTVPILWIIGLLSFVITVAIRTFLINSGRGDINLIFVIVGTASIIMVLIGAAVAVTINESEDGIGNLLVATLPPLGLLILSVVLSLYKIDVGIEKALATHYPFLEQKIVHGLGETTEGKWFTGVFGALIGAPFGCWFARLAVVGDTKFSWLWKMYVQFASRSGTIFNEADLTDANFSSAILNGTDFRNAKITRTSWRGVKSLEYVRVGNNYLKYPIIRQLVLGLRLRDKRFDGFNLEGINLESADLSYASFVGANLNQANLRNADLTNANLKQAKLDGTDLTQACLTGACVEGWNLSETTIIREAVCEFVFLKDNMDRDGIRKRLPQAPNIFNSGEFEQWVTGEHNTIQLLIRNNRSRQALATAFQQLIQNNPNITPEDFRDFRRVGDSDVLVTIRVPENAGEGAIAQEFERVYQQAQKEALPNSVEHDNQPLFDFIVKLIDRLGASMGDHIFNYGTFSKFEQVNAQNFVQGDYINFNQDLVQAAAQIQDIIDQLQKQGITVEVAQKQVARDMATQAQHDPTVKDKLVKWGQSLGDAAVSDVIKGVVKLAIRSAGIPLP
jgi:uncharacterized protein YjbI with pentapeptide repeats